MSRLKLGQPLLMNPGPTNVHADVRAALVTSDMSHRAAPFQAAVSETLALLVNGMGGDANYEAAMFVSSGTGANEAMIGAIDGSTLLISKGRYSERLGQIAHHASVPLVTWECEPYADFDLDEFSSVLDREQGIKNLLLVHLETTTGVLLPLEAIGEECRRRGIRLYVDAISSVGGHDFSLKRSAIAMCTVTPNKCLEGLPGISFVVVHKNALNDDKPNAAPSFYFDLKEQLRMCRDGRLPYTSAVPIVFAAREALRRWHREGIENRTARYARNAARLRQGLLAMGIELASSPSELSSNIITTILPGVLFCYAELAEALVSEGIELYSPSAIQTAGRAFFGTMGAIDEDDIDDFLDVFANYLVRVR